MATLLLEIPDESLVSKVRQACKMLVGVASVKVQKASAAQSKEYDVTKTAAYREALEDVKHGRVFHAESVDEMFKQILG